MLAVADSGQRGFFDASWCGNVVPRDSFYGLLAEHGERIVSDADFAECYSEGRGRPSIPPSRLAKILLLAYRCGVSDRQATELGLISGRAEQILDSTPMLGAAAVQGTVTLVRCCVRKLLDAVRVADSQAARELRCVGCARDAGCRRRVANQ